MEDYKTITAGEFSELDFSKYTLVDLREPDEILSGGIDGAINIPFSRFASLVDSIPKDKPVVIFCRSGNISGQYAEVLADRGYEVLNVEGGYLAYRELISGETASGENKAAGEQAPVFIDAKGLKCPGPIVLVADYLRDRPDGTRIRVEATEVAFYSDIQVWCRRTGNKLDAVSSDGGVVHADITRRRAVKAEADKTERSGKTFVLFSGDLDKTIAAFIMANGAAAMGRSVTLFFTFWGLNILRKPEKVSVTKSFIERMFGFMMPRGTKRLGLSRMNMCGAGAKMIRGIMKSKGVSSLEELMESAKAHGVRLVACQMSMDIMGIRREELIDGVELGGVATFLGSGEQSDMSLFI
ncbi:MAG: DsrE/DsrF/DrsH-like family protein [Oscillospiraceae bacterium]|nr:DsrE/DsrF/DrsH-like family protein [Oscillospiraceae bacterium]